MKKYLFCTVASLLLSSCVSPILMREPPSINYELDKMGDLLVSNSLMYIQNPLTVNTESKEFEIGFKLLVKSSGNAKNIKVNLNDTKFSYLQFNLGASCKFDSVNNSNEIEPDKEYIIDCKVVLAKSDIDKLDKNDLIGELKIPFNSDNKKYLISKINVRNEGLR